MGAAISKPNCDLATHRLSAKGISDRGRCSDTMPVRSLQVTSIEARRFTGSEESSPEQVRVDHNSTVTLVQKTADNLANIGFRYTASYSGLGVIKLEGTAQFEGDAQAIEETWQTENEMPQDVASELHTAVMQTCVPQAVGLSQDLELPPPVPIPQIQFEDGNARGEQGSGPEVH